MASLEDVAILGGPVLKGINWDALAAKGNNQHGISHASVYAGTYYYDYMRPAGIKAGKVRDTLDIDGITADEAYARFQDLYSAVKRVKNIAFEAAVQNVPFLGEESAMKMGVETLRAAVAICWFTALYSAELHRTGALQISGKMSEEEIVKHASQTTVMFECITLLDEWGILKPIKKKSELSAAPLAAIVVVVAVIAIAIVAFMVISIMDVSQKNSIMQKECEEARASGDVEVYEACLDALRTPNETLATQIYRDTIKEFAPYIAAIGAGVLLIGLSPFIVSRLSKAGEVSRRRKRKRRERQMEEMGL